jgi:hypothetical protein
MRSCHDARLLGILSSSQHEIMQALFGVVRVVIGDHIVVVAAFDRSLAHMLSSHTNEVVRIVEQNDICLMPQCSTIHGCFVVNLFPVLNSNVHIGRVEERLLNKSLRQLVPPAPAGDENREVLCSDHRTTSPSASRAWTEAFRSGS